MVSNPRSSPSPATAAWLLGALLAGIAAAPRAQAGSVYLSGPFLGGGNVTVPVESFREQKFRVTIAQQHDFSCGSAALSTLLTYSYKTPVGEADVFTSMFDNGDQKVIQESGFSLLDMKNYLTRRGLPAEGFRAPLAKLAEVRLPAIVLLNVRGYRHFVVVEGIDNGRVLMSDPAVGMRAEPVSEFEAQWNGVFFLILANIEEAQAEFNKTGNWAVAPRAPTDLWRYAADVQSLAQPAFLNPGRF